MTEHEIANLQAKAHEMAKEKGWWDEGYEKTPLECLALIHSEISEAAECLRDDPDPRHEWEEPQGPADAENNDWRGVWKPEGFVVELADAVIRILDLCGRYDLNLQHAITEKMRFNATRPVRHGKAK